MSLVRDGAQLTTDQHDENSAAEKASSSTARTGMMFVGGDRLLRMIPIRSREEQTTTTLSK